MTFTYLENQLVSLRDRQTKSYLEVFGTLKEPTRNVLGHVLDIASLLDISSLNSEYALFGGYGVLSHLMHTFGDNTAKVWRGSYDIDIAGTRKVLNALVRGYHIISNMPSPNLSWKRTLKLMAPEEKECKIDFSESDVSVFSSPEVNTHFGVKVSVVSPYQIIRGKLKIPKEERVHVQDILSMLSVLEESKVEVDNVVDKLNANERRELFSRLRNTTEFYTSRVGFLPSGKYLGKIAEALHKRRDTSQ